MIGGRWASRLFLSPILRIVPILEKTERGDWVAKKLSTNFERSTNIQTDLVGRIGSGIIRVRHYQRHQFGCTSWAYGSTCRLGRREAGWAEGGNELGWVKRNEEIGSQNQENILLTFSIIMYSDPNVLICYSTLNSYCTIKNIFTRCRTDSFLVRYIYAKKLICDGAGR